MRKLLVGDVHGCRQELETLLEQARFRPGVDQLWLVGDLINKGPDSQGVVELARRLQAKCVIGNHEYHLIRDARGEDTKRAWVQNFKITWGANFEPFLREVESWPAYIEDEEFFFVHAGLVPGRHPRDTDPYLLTNIRTWDGQGKRLWNHDDPCWFELYAGPKPVVFGHWAALEGVTKPLAFGLDTGCVYGKQLTGLWWDSKEIISVPALQVYSPID